MPRRLLQSEPTGEEGANPRSASASQRSQVLGAGLEDLAADDGDDGLAADLAAGEGGVAPLALEVARVDRPLLPEVDEGDVGVGPGGEGAVGDAEDAGGADGEGGGRP